MTSKTEDKKEDETKRPLAVKEPNTRERLDALEIRQAELEKMIEGHLRYHFGKV